MHKIGGAHLQYVYNHEAKFECKGMKTFGVTDYTNLVPPKCCGRTDGQTDGRTDRRTDGRTDGRTAGRTEWTHY